jgi:hypothetical protein
MLPSLIRQRPAIFGLSAVFILALLQSVAHGQVSFYGAPPPADLGGGSGGGSELEGSEGTDLGLGIFSHKPFRFSLYVSQGYDTNPNTLPPDLNPQGSMYTGFGGGVNYSFGSPRLQLGASLGGGATYYYNRPGDDVDFNGSFALSANYRASPRLAVSLVTSTAYLSQPDVAIVGGPNRQSGNYLYSNTTLSAIYQWSEIISTVTSYNFSALYYLENELNQNQGNISQTLAQSINWLWKPKTTLVAEYRINTITYYDGADLNQVGNYFLVGFDQIFNPRFFWNVRVGAQMNFNNNPVDGESIYLGPFMESTFRYQLGPASSLAWNMRYGTEQSGLFDVSQRQTFRTGLTLNHVITKRLAANLGLNYQNNYYKQGGVIDTYNENIISIGLGLSFKINRFASLTGGYAYTVDLAPASTGRNYNRSIAFLGANFSF